MTPFDNLTDDDWYSPAAVVSETIVDFGIIAVTLVSVGSVITAAICKNDSIFAISLSIFAISMFIGLSLGLVDYPLSRVPGAVYNHYFRKVQP